MRVPPSIVSAINHAAEIVITTHVIPDGDAIGSLLGLMHALESIGKRVTAALSDPVPEYLAFLPGADRIQPAECTREGYELAIVLDCGSPDRVGRCESAVARSARVVNIDHHATNTQFANVNWVDSSAAATAQLVLELVLDLGVELNSAIATCLFAGLSTDTGSFRYSSTTSHTFNAAALLTDAGAKPWEISQSIYDTKSYASLAALSEAILAMKFKCGGLLSSMDITRELMARYGVDESETEGFISYARSVAGVEVAVAFKEVAPEIIRIGFRSKSRVDVARVALDLGGGGHVRASGCTIEGSLERAHALVLSRLELALREAGYSWTD